jgi:RNA polymerase sigma-70 factor, ECF subfamily
MITYHTLTDRELTDLLNNRDVAAYEEIYNRYWKIMYGFARRMVQDHDQAKDIVQDAFTKLYANIGSTDFSHIQIAPYLYRTVKNIVIDLADRHKHREKYIHSLRDYLNAGQFVTDEAIQEKEIMRRIEEEIAQLPKKMRVIFELSRKEFMTRKEIADKINISEETVKKQIANAIKLLRSKLSMFFCISVMMLILLLNR